MGDWDPFAEDDKPQNAGGGTGEETWEIPGGGGHVLARDWQKLSTYVWGRLHKEAPWQEMPDPKPDLSWHKPGCTLEAWSHTAVKCEVGGGMVQFTLSRPEDGNRLVGPLMLALADAVVLLHGRPDLRLAVFGGEGRLLCSGGDPRGEGGLSGLEGESEELCRRALAMGAFPDGESRPARLLAPLLWQALATAPQFTVCLANGSAMGEGLGIVAACDMALALEGSFFSLQDIQHGLVPASVAPYVLGKVGTGVAKRLFCTCENLGAERARSEGLIDEVLPSLEEMQGRVRELAAQLTACGPQSVATAKELVLGVAGQQIVEPLMFYTSKMALRSLESVEAREASKAARSGRAKPWEQSPIQPLH